MTAFRPIPERPMHECVGFATHIGTREHQQDAGFADATGKFVRVFVKDGVSQSHDGGLAARTARDAMQGYFQRHETEDASTDQVLTAFRRAHAALVAKAEEEQIEFGSLQTTAAGFTAQGNRARVASDGDSHVFKAVPDGKGGFHVSLVTRPLHGGFYDDIHARHPQHKDAFWDGRLPQDVLNDLYDHARLESGNLFGGLNSKEGRSRVKVHEEELLSGTIMFAATDLINELSRERMGQVLADKIAANPDAHPNDLAEALVHAAKQAGLDRKGSADNGTVGLYWHEPHLFARKTPTT